MNFLQQEHQNLKEELAIIKTFSNREQENQSLKEEFAQAKAKSDAMMNFLQQENRSLREELAIIKGSSNQAVEKTDFLSTWLQQNNQSFKDQFQAIANSSTKLLEEFNLQRVMLKDLKEMSDTQSKSTSTISLLPSSQASHSGNTWTFDPMCKSANITLSEDKMTAKKINSYGHTAICGTIAFESGVFIWEVTVRNITAKNGDWVQFGVLDKSVNSNMDVFSVENTWSVTSKPSCRAYNMTVSVPNSAIFNDKTLRCTYNAQEGTFIVDGEGFKASGTGMKGKKIYPFVNLFYAGNEVTLKIVC